MDNTDKYERLKEEREKRKQKEMDELPIMLQALVNKRSYFEYADYSQYLLEEQINDDLLIVNRRLIDWMKKIDNNDNRYKELYELNLAMLRISTYFHSIQIVCKSSTVRVVEKDKEIKSLSSKLRTLELEIISSKNMYENQIKTMSEKIKFLEK